MACDEPLTGRIRAIWSERTDIAEKKMFGGVAFLSEGRMVVGVLGTSLVARVGKPQYEALLGQPHVRAFDFSGRPIRGYVYVDAAGIRTERRLRLWLDRCDAFVATLPAKPA